LFSRPNFLKQTNSAAAGKSAMVVFLPCVARGSFQLRLDPSENTKARMIMTNEISQTKATATNCHCCASFTRRQMLAGTAATAAASILPAAVVHGQSAKSKVIDTHYHFYPPAYQKAWLGWEEERKIPHFANQLGWTPERAVDQLDRNGIAAAVLSVASTPGVWFGLDAKGAQNMVQICNDYGAEMARDHKGRFGLFATLSMLDIDATLNEIEYVFGTLKADGVGLQTSYGDKWLGDPFFRPVLEELNRRGAVVYVHPLVADCCGQLSVGALPAVIEVPHDTTRTVTSLLLSGTLARLRDIKWLFSHAGGTIPMLAGRIDAFYGQRAAAAGFAPDGIMAELRRLHYDTANATSVPSMAALTRLVPATQITFGSDYPYFPLSQIETLRNMNLPSADLQAIESGNVGRLIPRLNS
jgi:6-methylsalicylate decarboxylase